MTNKIIFLDIDGVLRPLGDKHLDIFQFEPLCVRELNMLVEATHAKIVVSSSWRRIGDMYWLKDTFHKNGVIAEIVGVTPSLQSLNRGEEIEAYLDDLPKPRPKFIILDDGDDLGRLSKYLIKTDPRRGLTQDDARDGIKMLAPNDGLNL